MTVIETFAEFSATTRPPAEAMDEAKRCLLDWLGCTIPGGVEAPATLLRRALPGSGPARLIPDGAPSDARTAALINGTASHTVEVDDIFSPALYHPGVVTIPAALALAEAEGASGETLLRAIVAGYEIGTRIGRAVNPAHYSHWHTTATVGHFGAAAAACVVLGLDAARTAHALGNVATMAAGLRHAFSSDAMTKPIHAGRAAEAGVLAALAAAHGVTGVADMLEGPRGFGVAMSGDVDWAPATQTLGSEWLITRTTRKAHACCGHNFPALDAIQLLMERHGIGAGDIEAIEVGGYRATAEICGNPAPRTAAEGRFSLPYCAAVIAREGAVTPAAFTDAALAEPETRALAARVSVGVDEDAESRFPARRSAIVTLRTTDGRSVEHRRPTRRGDPDDPLDDAQILAKFRALADPVIGAQAAQALADAVARVDTLDDVRALPIGAPDQTRARGAA